MTSWQKGVKYAAMAFAIFLIVSIIGGILSAAVSFSFVWGDTGAVAGENKTYTVNGEVQSLKIDIAAADLEIKVGEEFSVESNHKYLTVEQNGSRLTITEKRRGLNSYTGVNITLTVPQDTLFEKADISTGAGRVKAETLSAEKLDLTLGAGEAVIEDLNASYEASINGGAGKLTVKGGTMRELELDMGVGEVSLTGKLTGESSLDLGVGRAELVLVGASDDYRIDFDKGIGNATLDGAKMRDDSVYGTGENEIDIDGGVGEIEISFRGN